MSGYNTQGEWEAIGNLVRTKRAPDGSGGWLVAECPHVEPDAKKNAARIAALPELIEALELADAALSGANMNMAVVEAKIRAALAKAKGDAS